LELNWEKATQEEDNVVQPRALLYASAALALSAGAAVAQETVVLWHPFSLETDMIHGGIASFNESQDDYRVEARIVPGPQIATELVKAIATGSVPDLVTIDNPVVPSFSAQGVLEDLTDLVAESDMVKPDNYFEGPWNSVLWEDRIYGVPRDSNTLALYYNADMFREKGLDPENPPETWSELMAAAEKLRDPANNVFGFGFSALQSEEGPFQWLPFLYQNGGSIEELNSPEAVEALQLWVDFVEKDLVTQDVINMRQYEVANTFMAGNAAMVIGGPWELPRMEKDAKFDWRLALLPLKDGKDIRASSLGGYDYLIPEGANEVEGAFAFIEFMSQPEILNEGWKTGRLAPRSDIVVENPQWPQAYEVYREQLGSARARGPHPRWPEISRPIQLAIQEALTGSKTPQQALDDAAAAIAPILAEQPL
jgi:multiple sugar transport system substrate-binding protein